MSLCLVPGMANLPSLSFNVRFGELHTHVVWFGFLRRDSPYIYFYLFLKWVSAFKIILKADCFLVCWICWITFLNWWKITLQYFSVWTCCPLRYILQIMFCLLSSKYDFRNGHGTSVALLNLFHILPAAQDNGNKQRLVLDDFGALFDIDTHLWIPEPASLWGYSWISVLFGWTVLLSGFK